MRSKKTVILHIAIMALGLMTCKLRVFSISFTYNMLSLLVRMIPKKPTIIVINVPQFILL